MSRTTRSQLAGAAERIGGRHRHALFGAAWSLGLSAILVSSSCAPPRAQTGDLIVPFVLGNAVSCGKSDVRVVVAFLDDDRSAEAECDAGAVVFSDVPAGAYDVKLFGYAEDNTSIVMDSLATKQLFAQVAGGATTTLPEDVVLTAAPVRLELRWGFGFRSCESNGVDRFVVSAWIAGGTDPLLTAELGCTQDTTDHDNYRTVPDPERDLKGGIVGQVSIQALRVDGAAVGKPAIFEFDPPGSGSSIRLTVECGQTGCAGTGMPDPLE